MYTEIDSRDELFLKDFSRQEAVRVNPGRNGKPFSVSVGNASASSQTWSWKSRALEWEGAREMLHGKVRDPEQRLENIAGIREGHDYWFELHGGERYSGEVVGVEKVDGDLAEVYVENGVGEEVVSYYSELPEDPGPDVVVEWGYEWE